MVVAWARSATTAALLAILPVLTGCAGLQGSAGPGTVRRTGGVHGAPVHGVGGVGTPAPGDTISPAVAAEVRALASDAAVIFVGQVTAIDRTDADDVVTVHFRVEQGIAGVASGSVYTLREWAGLWTGGTDRYRLGERCAMLLAAAGPAGLAAPVGGTDGIIPVSGGDAVTIDSKGDPVPDTGANEEHADLRWIAARTERAPLIDEHAGAGAQTALEAPVPRLEVLLSLLAEIVAERRRAAR